MAKKRKQKKPRRVSEKVTSSEKKAAAKRKAAHKPAVRKRPVRERQAVMDSQSAATLPLKRPVRVEAGGGDFVGVSAIEGADSESASELLEEGQTLEAGIVSGVENAPDPDQGEVQTHEVSQDDVPEEYDDKDRP